MLKFKIHVLKELDLKKQICPQLLSATVREDGYELCLSVNFALRSGGAVSSDDATYRGLTPGRRSSLTRFASQDSLLGRLICHWATSFYLLN